MKTSRRGINFMMGFGHFDLSELPCFEDAVNELQHYLPFSLTQGQFDALVSFAHDVGMEPLTDFGGKSEQFIADEMMRYCYFDGQKDPTVERRRAAERSLFLPRAARRPTAGPANTRGGGFECGGHGGSCCHPSGEVPPSHQEAEGSPSSEKPQESGGFFKAMGDLWGWAWDKGYVQEGASLLAGYLLSNNSAGTNNSSYGRTETKKTGTNDSHRRTETKKSTHDIVLEVIRGDWGNGPERKRRLREAGYDPRAVQDEVNRLKGVYY